jgi:hypothetical protein
MSRAELSYPALRKPDCVTTAGRVFYGVFHDPEAALVEESAVFGAVEACVIERLAFEGAYGLTIPGAACEHEGGTGRCMCPKDGEHLTLVSGGQVKEAVPG